MAHDTESGNFYLKIMYIDTIMASVKTYKYNKNQ